MVLPLLFPDPPEVTAELLGSNVRCLCATGLLQELGQSQLAAHRIIGLPSEGRFVGRRTAAGLCELKWGVSSVQVGRRGVRIVQMMPNRTPETLDESQVSDKMHNFVETLFASFAFGISNSSFFLALDLSSHSESYSRSLSMLQRSIFGLRARAPLVTECASGRAFPAFVRYLGTMQCLTCLTVKHCRTRQSFRDYSFGEESLSRLQNVVRKIEIDTLQKCNHTMLNLGSR